LQVFEVHATANEAILCPFHVGFPRVYLGQESVPHTRAHAGALFGHPNLDSVAFGFASKGEIKEEEISINEEDVQAGTFRGG
jgi:hypothetical protein